MRIYISGPYRAATGAEVDRNIRVARDAMAALLRLGHTPFCPHSMTARFERDYPDLPDARYLNTDLEWLRLCDAILLLPGWEESEGALVELTMARSIGLRVFEELAEVEEIPFLNFPLPPP